MLFCKNFFLVVHSFSKVVASGMLWLYFFVEQYVCVRDELSERYACKVSALLPGTEIE